MLWNIFTLCFSFLKWLGVFLILFEGDSVLSWGVRDSSISILAGIYIDLWTDSCEDFWSTEDQKSCVSPCVCSGGVSLPFCQQPQNDQ